MSVSVFTSLMAGVDQAPLVIVKGMAGTANFLCVGSRTGKTMEQDGIFRRVMVVRPNTQLTMISVFYRDLNRKIAPLMRPIIDNGFWSIETSMNATRMRTAR